MARAVRALLLALLCVLAVSTAATTLTDTQASGAGTGSGSDAIDGDAPPQPDSDEDGSDSGLRSSEAPAVTLTGTCFPVLFSPWFLALALAALGGAVWLLGRRLDTLRATAMVALPAMGIGIPVYVLLTDCGTSTATASTASPMPEIEAAADVDAGGAVGGGGVESLVSPLVAVVVLAILLGVVAFAAYNSRGGEAESASAPDALDDERHTEPLEAVGSAAGGAADRIEATGDVDNEVYRAWREMTMHVDVPNPASSTPAEFEAAARAAGMTGEDIEALTAVFRDVRYGGEAPTEDRERRAVDALRTIEDRYAGGDT